MSGKKSKRLNAEISPDLWKEVKIRLIEEGITLRELITNLLQDWLQDPKKNGNSL